jgi:hypothetical protein
MRSGRFDADRSSSQRSTLSAPGTGCSGLTCPAVMRLRSGRVRPTLRRCSARWGEGTTSIAGRNLSPEIEAASSSPRRGPHPDVHDDQAGEVQRLEASSVGRGLHELACTSGADLLVVGSCRRGLVGRDGRERHPRGAGRIVTERSNVRAGSDVAEDHQRVAVGIAHPEHRRDGPPHSADFGVDVGTALLERGVVAVDVLGMEADPGLNSSG